MPMMCWAGAIASIPSDEVIRLCNSILSVTNYRHACDTPAVAVWEVLGWECNPSFARKWAALRDAVGFVCKPPCWLDVAPLPLLSRRWPTLLPLAAQVLEELGWWTFDHGARICKCDGLGNLRSFVVGVDSLSILGDWLRDWHRMAALESTTRVASALHRGEDELARGALLPGVPLKLAFSLPTALVRWARNSLLTPAGAQQQRGPRPRPRPRTRTGALLPIVEATAVASTIALPPLMACRRTSSVGASKPVRRRAESPCLLRSISLENHCL